MTKEKDWKEQAKGKKEIQEDFIVQCEEVLNENYLPNIFANFIDSFFPNKKSKSIIHKSNISYLREKVMQEIKRLKKEKIGINADFVTCRQLLRKTEDNAKKIIAEKDNYINELKDEKDRLLAEKKRINEEICSSEYKEICGKCTGCKIIKRIENEFKSRQKE